MNKNGSLSHLSRTTEKFTSKKKIGLPSYQKQNLLSVLSFLNVSAFDLQMTKSKLLKRCSLQSQRETPSISNNKIYPAQGMDQTAD